MKLVSKIPTEIEITNMRDGDIGIITKWPNEDHIGEIVQRFGNSLVVLGKWARSGWPKFFDNPTIEDNNFEREKYKVFILPEGTTLEV